MVFTELTTFIKSYIDACLLAIVEAGNSRKLSPDGLTEFERNYMQDLAGDDVIKQGVVRQLVQFINQTLITDDSIWQKLDGVTVAENLANKIEVLDSPKLGGELAEIWAKKSDVSLAISELIGGAPAALDVLNELAAAINNDANFSTTIVNLIGTKLNSSAYTAEDVFAKVKSLDVDEGGLNASTLKGLVPQTSATDATEGRLMKIGAFGLGSENIETIYNADTLTKSGNYSTSSAFIGSPFIGSNGENQGYLRHVQWANPIYAEQHFSNVNGAFNKKYRRRDAGVWTAWKDIYTSANPDPSSGKVKSTSDDTAGYLGEKLGDGLLMGADKKATLDFSKVLKNEGFNSSMLKIPVQFIKNKELDVRLPYTNYDGNPYGVGTPLLVTNVNGNIITVSNVPYVEYLFNDLQTINWWNMIAMNKHTGEADSILGFTNTGAYTSESAVTAATYGATTSTFTVLNGAVFTIGDTIALHSARNKYFKFYPDLVYNRLSGGKYAGVYAVMKKNDGNYTVVAGDIGDTSGSRLGIYTTDKLAKNYTQMTDTGTQAIFNSADAGFDTSPWSYVAGQPTFSADLNCWLQVAWGFVGGVKTHKLCVISKGFESIKYYTLNIEYSKIRSGANDSLMVGYSVITYHAGIYYLMVTEQSTTYKTPAESWINTCYTSKTIGGKFRYHSTPVRGCNIRNDGVPSSSHNTNGWLFTFNGRLYYWATVTGRTRFAGNKAKICTVVYILNEEFSEWEMLPTSMILNPRYTGGTSPWGYGSSDSWAKDHIGSFGGALFEEGKMKLFIGANNGTDTYQGGYAEIRLYDSSPDFTTFG